jgi:hypothetical protein
LRHRRPDTGGSHDKRVNVSGALTTSKGQNHGRATDKADFSRHPVFPELLVQEREHPFQFAFGEAGCLDFHGPSRRFINGKI